MLTILGVQLNLLPTIATLAIVLFSIYLYISSKLNYWKKRGLNGPKPVPVFGNLFPFFVRTQGEIELEWRQKYGKVYGIYKGHQPSISVADPELAKLILVRDFETFRNRRDQQTDHAILSKVLTTSRDDDWKRIRAIASPTFTSGKMKKMYPIISECCDEFVESLDEYAKRSAEIDLKRLHGAYTLDVIARCAFATLTNTHQNPDNEFTRHLTNIFNMRSWKIMLFFVMPSFLAKSESFRGLVLAGSSLDFVIDFMRALIKKRKDSREQRNDFLQLLIDVERKDSVLTERDTNEGHHVNEGNDEISAHYKALSNVAEKKLTENEILAQCLVFFLAGYETTATTLSFCSYELALNPQIQDKLHAEIRMTVEKSGKIDYETLLSLPYLDAVLSETLRKYPPALRLERQASSDYKLGDTGVTIPKGMSTEIPVYAIHYDPEYYPSPQAFSPERFLPENRQTIRAYAYLPFGSGPRNCIGMRFALLEAKLALFNIVHRFRFVRTNNTDIPLEIRKGRRILGAKRIIVGIERR